MAHWFQYPNGDLLYAADVYCMLREMENNRHHMTNMVSEESQTQHDRPPYSYSALIAMAITSHPGQKATLKQIYRYIEYTFPYYRAAKHGWKNSIRHSLSLNECFTKIPREMNEMMHGHFWKLTADWEEKNFSLCADGSFRRRHKCQKLLNASSTDKIKGLGKESSADIPVPISDATIRTIPAKQIFAAKAQSSSTDQHRYTDFSVERILKGTHKRKFNSDEYIGERKRVKYDVDCTYSRCHTTNGSHCIPQVTRKLQ